MSVVSDHAPDRGQRDKKRVKRVPEEIKVDGLAGVLRDLRRLKDKEVPKAIRQANKNAAEMVAATARVEVPVKSGRLKRSIKAQATQKSASVKAGTAARVPYAAVVHFGWAKRHIRPQPFIYEALDRRIAEVREAYERQLNQAIEKFNH
jgi:HK97 gp10 family phage protein